MNVQGLNLEKPNRTSEFELLSNKAYKYLIEQQKIIEDKYGIHNYENWFYDQETGIITFSNAETNNKILSFALDNYSYNKFLCPITTLKF